MEDLNKHVNAPVDAKPAMAALNAALTRDVPALEAGLDIAFGELRAARMAISAPWAVDASAPPLERAELVEQATDLAPGDHAAGLAAAISDMPMAQAVDAEPPVLPQKILQDVQRKSSAQISGFMSTMQIRDELAQRVSHLHAALDTGKDADDPAVDFFATVIATQAEALVDDLERVFYDILGGSHALVDIVANCAEAAHVGDDPIAADSPARDRAMAALDASFRLEGNIRAEAWRRLFTNIRRAGMSSICPPALALRLARAQATMDVAAAVVPAMRESATELLQTAKGVPVAVESLDLEHPVLAELWQSYTVDAEREVHTRMVQRRQAAA